MHKGDMRGMFAMFAVTAAAAVILNFTGALTGCGDDTEVGTDVHQPADAHNGGTCSSNFDCPNGYTCQGGACVASAKPDGGGDHVLADSGPADGGTGDTGPSTVVTIYQIQNPAAAGHPAVDTLVTIEGVIATTPVAVISATSGLNGFFVEEKAGGAFSGIIVVGKAPAFPATVTPGDVFDVTGTYREYKGATDTRSNSEIEVTAIEKIGTDAAPAPAVVGNPGDIATGGTLSEDFQGVLVKVSGVQVTAANDQFGQWKVTGDLLVDRLFYQFNPPAGPPVGLAIWELTGVMYTSHNDYKIEPRSAADIVYDTDAGLPDGGEDGGTGDTGTGDGGSGDTGQADAGTGTPTCPGLADHVVISQFASRGTGADGGAGGNNDFVEVYNATSGAVDISGWKLQAKTSSGAWNDRATVPVNTILQSNRYFLFANSSADYQGPPADVTYGSGFADSSSLKIMTAGGAEVDKVGFGTGGGVEAEGTALPALCSSACTKSYVRKAYPGSTDISMAGTDADKGNGFDSNDNSADFVVLQTRAPRNNASAAGIPICDQVDAGAPDTGTPDAGTDDTGAADGGTPDAGDDAGTVDGGVLDDTGTTDAGAPDGGTDDTGAPDGGIADDTGPADTGAADGGTTDGGTADGGTTDGGTAPDCTGIASHIVISQIQVAGTGGASDEFVEIYNPTGADIDIAGWRMQYKGGSSTTWNNFSGGVFPAPTTVKTHGYYLMTAGGYSGSVTGDRSYTDTMATAAGHVQLINGSSAVIDKVGYGTAIDPEGGAAATAPPSGQSVMRRSYSTGYVAGKGNGYDTDNNANDFTAPGASAPRNSAAAIETPDCPLPCNPPTPPACEKQSGICAGSVHAAGQCVGGVWQACDATNYGADYEATETKCDGKDNDCDGNTDNSLPDQACPLQQGVCVGSKKACGGTLGWLDCTATSYGADYAAADKCHGLDNDCNGTPDQYCAIDWADTQWAAKGLPADNTGDAPQTITLNQNEATGDLFGQVYINGFTSGSGDPAVLSPFIEAQVGIGPSDETNLLNWTWSDASFSGKAGIPANNYEYKAGVPYATFYKTGKNAYRFVFRYSRDGGTTWMYGAYNNHNYADPASIPAGDMGTINVKPCDPASPTPCEKQAGVCAGALHAASECGPTGWAPCVAADYLANDSNYQETETKCDGLDNDCTGTPDDIFTFVDWDLSVKHKADTCGTGACAGGTVVCKSDQTGVECSTGHLASPEVCGGGDENCNGAVDEAGATGCSTYYRDDDGDGYGVTSDSKCLCAAAAPYTATVGGDCSDNPASDPPACSPGPVNCSNPAHSVCAKCIHPGAAEVCDGVDNDCTNGTDAADVNLVITACEKQAGVCAGKNHGASQCVGGVWQACGGSEYGVDYEAAETKCDGKDNDCNGTADDNPVCSAGLWCRLQWPLTITDTAGATSPTVYGRLYIAGLTDQTTGNDTSPALKAQVGYGADGSAPSGWSTWVDASPNPGWDGGAAGEPNNDEYQATFTLPLVPGAYDYAFRFSGDRGTTWVYCDKNAGAGSDGSQDGYQAANAGALTVNPNCTGVASHVVISQFQVQGTPGASDEFVELYNPTGGDIAINGWRLRYKTDVGGAFNTITGTTLPAGSVIKAHGYFLFTATGYDDTVVGDRTGYTAGLANAAGHVQLYTGSAVVDTVGYGATADSAEGGHPASAPPSNQSIKRKSFASGLYAGFGNGYDTDDNANDFTSPAVSAPRNSSSPIENSGCP